MKKITSMAIIILIACTGIFISCESADDLFRQGTESYANGDYEQSIDFFTKAIERKPSAQYYYNRGNAYYVLQKWNSALDDYNAALNLDKDYSDAYLWRGFNYFVLEKYQESQNDLSYYTTNHKDNYDAYLYLGNASSMLNDAEKAVEAYTAAINLDPEKTPAYNMRGAVYSALENYKLARADFDKSLAIEPENELAVNGIKDIEEAEAQALRDSIRSAFTSGDPYTDAYNWGYQFGLDAFLGN